MIKLSKTTARFDRSIKKLAKKHYDLRRLDTAIDLILVEDHETLKHRFDWHMLVGNHAGVNEIHLDKNWLLLYQITDENELTLLLLDTGSHDIL
ncbi:MULTISPECIES: type II toxin-antitoxin system YafQ family toxin [Levilactobacillus]|uniref:type II toxin-antitoxin system RelE/ParE family toxin n=1 Tax=Levilactobacillus TaxID=2767886 RepID=UPI0019521784|nr:type II toxin-antitoxin system mRNA interferase toxin, RelE/StbE family [Levilactobacillus sp. 244-2]